MAKVELPDGINSYLNPVVHTAVNAEGKKAQGKISGRKIGRTSPFAGLLDTASSEAERAAESLQDASPSEEHLRQLLDDVHEAGEELKARAVQSTILRYKAAVRQFLHYIVENSYTVEERTSGMNILKRKKFTLIQVVDRKLEQLAAGILAGQSNQLDILARLDEIAGLLIDLSR